MSETAECLYNLPSHAVFCLKTALENFHWVPLELTVTSVTKSVFSKIWVWIFARSLIHDLYKPSWM